MKDPNHDKKNKLFKDMKDKKKEYMAWFTVRDGHYRGIGVEKLKDLDELLDAGEEIIIRKYKDPKTGNLPIKEWDKK